VVPGKAEIARSEYDITWQDRTALPGLAEAWQAPNRANGFRTYFTPSGIRVVPRDAADAPGWVWGLTLTGFGNEGALGPAPHAELLVSGNRIEFSRGELTEWYVNDERGLEQGFTITAPPTGPSPGSFLQVDLGLFGNLTPTVAEDGQAIEFTTAGGVSVLRYSELHAFDATGDDLAARMDPVNPGTLRLTVEAAGATYPITIDPLSTMPNWTAEGDQDGAYFGFAVGTAGDVNGDGFSDVIVGAAFYDIGVIDQGRAFVYHGAAVGLSSTADWTAEGDQNTYFGYSVATAGDANGDGYSDVIVGPAGAGSGEVTRSSITALRPV
jgi:hypothetical protein